ncbi:multi-sensor signal transduction histidine kinase [Candidatus Magnetobacterium bavaricum]|uniref:histidine kinase n=1 Tax=Candidatus Magnetobacterium bavaricum TaxID=29290 RepID=A0A0F3GX44_9BACT|nr:multi-sensor signal transduction histidine kinase [Candidatus Magnetobacterium bavaricum]
MIPYYFNGFIIEVEGRRCLVGIGIDISERKEIEREIREINLNLQDRINDEVAKNRLRDQIMFEQSRHVVIGELLVNISHHWRQPLCAIGLLMQDIRDAYLHGELDIEYIESNVGAVMSELGTLSETIDNFRNFYINDKEPRHFNVSRAIDRAVMLLSGYLKDTGTVIDKTLDEDLTINGFPNEFAQVILNILTNAKDIFEKRNIINPTIKINSYKDSPTGNAVVTITDNGGGIPEDIIDKIFDPYFTTKDKTRGTGNGLYMAKVLIEKNMTGKISARNLDAWCEFRIVI